MWSLHVHQCTPDRTSCTGADVASSCNRYKATIICQEVAKAKNVCQVCLLDLEYGIPVQARDTALGIEDESLPESDVGKEFRLKEMENAGLLESSFSKVCLISASPQHYFCCLSCLLTDAPALQTSAFVGMSGW